MTYQVPTHVRSVESEAGVVVADLRKGLYFSLNGVGALVWRTLLAHGSTDDAVGQVLQKFNVPEHQATADVESFISELAREGLLELSEDT